jgi:hypothetical protein
MVQNTDNVHTQQPPQGWRPVKRLVTALIGATMLTLGGTTIAGAVVDQRPVAGGVLPAGDMGTLGVSECVNHLVDNYYRVTITRSFACAEAAGLGTPIAAIACASIMTSTHVDALTAVQACGYAII